MSKYWNGQRYCECHLIALWNAATHYGIPVPVRYGKEYVEDCDKARAIHGGCIHSNHVIDKLQLEAVKGFLTWDWIKDNCPVELKIFCHRGYHSVLVVGVNLKKKKILLANYAKDRLCWLKIERVIEMHNNHASPVGWVVKGK